jgi:F-type H+-transporting ATPase subunit b
MPQLDPTWFASQLFWLVMSFIALYFILARLILPRLQNVFEARQETLSSDLGNAETMTHQANHARQDYERALAEARGKAQQLLSDAMLTHKSKAEAAAKSMDAQVADMLEKAEKRIAAKKDDLMQALVPTSTELASLVVEKLTREALAQETVQSITSNVIKARG